MALSDHQRHLLLVQAGKAMADLQRILTRLGSPDETRVDQLAQTQQEAPSPIYPFSPLGGGMPPPFGADAPDHSLDAAQDEGASGSTPVQGLDARGRSGARGSGRKSKQFVAAAGPSDEEPALDAQVTVEEYERMTTEQIGRQIRAARRFRHLATADLARMANMRTSVLTDYEVARHRPSIVLIRRLAQALRMSVYELIYGAGEWSTEPEQAQTEETGTNG